MTRLIALYSLHCSRLLRFCQKKTTTGQSGTWKADKITIEWGAKLSMIRQTVTSFPLLGRLQTGKLVLAKAHCSGLVVPAKCPPDFHSCGRTQTERNKIFHRAWTSQLQEPPTVLLNQWALIQTMSLHNQPSKNLNCSAKCLRSAFLRSLLWLYKRVIQLYSTLNPLGNIKVSESTNLCFIFYIVSLSFLSYIFPSLTHI